MDENGREKTYTGLSSNKANITVYSNQVPTITSFSPAAAVVYQRSGVITSYSIHYTKLYETKREIMAFAL